ncbi:MAG: hypothetical protein MUC42_15365, partial [Bryobacter sp.]|nr:hypothetical protein [Bryobacter sp.]
GGRGGRTLIVSTLADKGPGSLRAALEAKGPRIVVFRVAGIIDLEKPLTIAEPFVTVAGQSAPGDGICLRKFGIRVATHDVVLRHLRVRPGDLANDEVDGIAIGGDSHNVVVDHCSVSWAVDENLSPSGAIRDVTVQWSIIAEALNRSVHKKGSHGYGSLVRAIGGVSLHHNLWAHNSGRNPRLGDNYGKPPYPTHDVRNNVIYNQGGPSVAGDTFTANYVANYTKPGPSTKGLKMLFNPTEKAQLQFFFDGNVIEGKLDSFTSRPIVEVKAPFTAPAVTTLSALAARDRVLAEAGATLPRRDSVDARIVADVRNATGRIIDKPQDAGGWPAYASAEPPPDSDLDGMPDSWESARGLNPRNPADAAALAPSGYSNLEEFLNAIQPAGVNTTRPGAASK